MIHARTKILNMAPPRLRRMIWVADLATGGYGSLEGTKEVVCIVVVVVGSDMFFFWRGRGGGWRGGFNVERRRGRMTSMTSERDRRVSWMGSVREMILFFFSPSFWLLLVVANLQK